MTTSRYTQNMTFDQVICMSKEEYVNFTTSIETGCTFSIKYNPLLNRHTFPICPFIARYYGDNEQMNYHVTNDTRRKIQKYLKRNEAIKD